MKRSTLQDVEACSCRSTYVTGTLPEDEVERDENVKFPTMLIAVVSPGEMGGREL